MLNDSESHHRAALDGFGVALGRVTRARLLLELAQADVDERWRYYEQLGAMQRTVPHTEEHS